LREAARFAQPHKVRSHRFSHIHAATVGKSANKTYSL
jgi:hypothetical protein